MDRARLHRTRDPALPAKVTNVELFFDLVFVFAITQLSHALLKDLTPLGAARTGLLFLAVWWGWIYTSWVTNWLDPDRLAVRLLLFGLMLVGLVLSTSIPRAFAERGFAFAAAYAALQVGRSAYMVWAMRGISPGNHRNFQRITVWFAVSAGLWLAGGLSDGPARLTLWALAVAGDYAGPSFGFAVPGLGRSRTADWTIEGEHMAERCGLFVIIALGESLLVTGATFEGLDWTAAPVLSGFLVAFVGTIALWWIYFDTGAGRGSHSIAHAADPGRLARLAYTYVHMPIVAGIVIGAVGDELLLSHPEGDTGFATAAVTIGGAALFVAGNLLFKTVVVGRPPLSHAAGLGLLAACAVAPASGASPLVLAGLVNAVLVVVAVWESVSLRRGWRRPA